jgi:6-pyruvoyltetrahydropterin/6-carboxytetrahydropterin synthase
VHQVGTAIAFPARHVMPGMPGPEGVLHEHQYRLELVVEREQLDELGMVCDLDILRDVLSRIEAVVRDQDLEVIRPADAKAVTVEVFAAWAHRTLSDELRSQGVDRLTVRVYENADAFGGISQAVD